MVLKTRRFEAVAGPAEGLVEVVRARRFVVDAVVERERSAVSGLRPIPEAQKTRWYVVEIGLADEGRSAVVR